MITVTATEFQNNFGKYLQCVQNGDEIIILRNGKEVARLISHEISVSFLSDSLCGVLNDNVCGFDTIIERVKKYESND